MAPLKECNKESGPIVGQLSDGKQYIFHSWREDSHLRIWIATTDT